MTSQAVSPKSQAWSRLDVGRAGLILGVLLGGLHLPWALLVASGWAQPLMDFIFWLHFIKPIYVIEGFAPLRAASLVLLTGTIGYAIGGACALCVPRG
jgi:hypothetical protein